MNMKCSFETNRLKLIDSSLGTNAYPYFFKFREKHNKTKIGFVVLNEVLLD